MEVLKEIKLIKPGYWIIVFLFLSLVISLLVKWWSNTIDDQISKQEKIVKELTAKVEYATWDIAKRITEYNALFKLNGWAMKTLAALKKSKESLAKVKEVDLDNQFLFTWHYY